MTSSTLNRLAGLIPDMALKDRIQELVDAGHSKSELARAAKKSPAAVTHWLNGATLEIKSDSAAGLQALTGFNAVWIATGKGPKKSGPEYPRQFAIDPSKYRLAWVVGRGSGGFLPETIWTDGDYPTGGEVEYAEVASGDPKAFIVEVIGPSMAPRYNPGEFALVEPGTEPDIEDDVLIRLTSGQTMIKRLLSRRAGYRFGSYNDPEILTFQDSDVSWVYYVAHPVPARKIKSRT